MNEIEELRAEVERLRYEANLRDQVVSMFEACAEAAEARLRNVEALADEWTPTPAVNKGDTFGYAAERIRAALAEGAKRPSPPEAEGSGSAEPAEQKPAPFSRMLRDGGSPAPGDPGKYERALDDLFPADEPAEVTPPART